MNNIDRNNGLLKKVRDDHIDGKMKYKGLIFFVLADISKSLASIADTLAGLAGDELRFHEENGKTTS